MPWWIGVVSAVGSYLLLHRIAAQAVVATSPHLLTTVWLKGLASAGQYFIPLICLFGALASFLRRRHRQSLLANATSSRSAAAFDGMTWREFEMLVGQVFRSRGYRVMETGGQGADGGVDLIGKAVMLLRPERIGAAMFIGQELTRSSWQDSRSSTDR